ncbi:MAG TPA: glycosyltransferase, partial [Sphingomicrobium sp.]|nr:glycosyltransferase [Sphingomicrobium sp.]
DAGRLRAMKARLEAAGIDWTRRRYHKAPSAPATAFDIAAGIATALAIAKRHRVRLVHARSYIPALIGMAVKRLAGARLLFDMRGLWADERVDGGLWPAGGSLYRVTKSIERRLLHSADHIVTLTYASVDEVRKLSAPHEWVPLSVIPTCTDLRRFRPRPSDPGAPPTFGYVGSVGTWYLFDETLLAFRYFQAERPDARLLVVNRGEHQRIASRIAAAGIDPACTEVVAAEHRDVPALIARMSAGAALVKPAYSKIASAPTKLAEYLACGIPVLGNTGVGDVEILEERKVGVAVESLDEAVLRAGVARLVALTRDRDTPGRCRTAAEELFSLDRGVAEYRRIYDSLLAGGGEERR